MPDTKTLYDEDFLAWSKEQAAALRAAQRGGSNLALDWGNLAEEIESLGKSEQSALGSQIRRIIEHLLKMENARASGPRRGWKESIIDARVEIEVLLQRNPSLANYLPTALAEEDPRGARKAVAARIRSPRYTQEQILGDWFPPEPRP